MKIYTVPAGQLDMNGYILTKDGKEAIVIDCGGKKVLEEAKKHDLKVTHLLLTHGHFDHMIGCHAMRTEGVQIGISKEEEQEALSSHNEGEFCYDPVEKSELNKFLKDNKFDFIFHDGDILHFANFDIQVIATAGHTKGSVCFLIENHLFSGDTLFYECVGRTDLSSGNHVEMQKSIDKLLQLDDSIVVHPGHGWDTTIAHEKKYNPLSKYRQYV